MWRVIHASPCMSRLEVVGLGPVHTERVGVNGALGYCLLIEIEV